ncbi:GNAT family N-acetyltransferase [Alkalihalobacterium bogoriense]|uniref:GNAT family N-acetyltransferase n=1 Tax=Alkalihalobacterium bogoriense TaxID=246272 RepID=UPI00047D1739|nr:GNAT family N-acetyltransferase [Alkalihalobacterium bogoriense]
MYRKEVFVFENDTPVKAIVRNYTLDDFDDLYTIQQESFPPPFPSELLWNKQQIHNHVSLFQEGALCVEINDQVIGSMTTLLVSFDPIHPLHTWEEITDKGYIRNHNPNGNTLYVVDIGVRPGYRRLQIGKLLMQSMYDLVIYKKLDRLLGGGRMPGFEKVATEMSADQYVQAVLSGNRKDPVLSFLLRCGRTPVALVPNYLKDEESLNYGLLMEWKNPFKIK